MTAADYKDQTVDESLAEHDEVGRQEEEEDVRGHRIMVAVIVAGAIIGSGLGLWVG